MVVATWPCTGGTARADLVRQRPESPPISQRHECKEPCDVAFLQIINAITPSHVRVAASPFYQANYFRASATGQAKNC